MFRKGLPQPENQKVLSFRRESIKLLETNMTGNTQRKFINREFHSTFATIAITILSIMLAFYGIAVITLSQQAQVASENAQTYKGLAQTSEANAVGYLRQTDDAIRNFAYTTEPLPGSANWSIPMDQQSNLMMIFSPFKNDYVSSSNVVINSDVDAILSNFTEGLRMENVTNFREWLSYNNVTYFLADFLGAIFPLHDLMNAFYEQFPTPPAIRNQSQAIVFIDSNFSNTQPFLSWFQAYQSFYQGVSDAHSKISFALSGICQAYLDSATMDSQDLQQLNQENSTNAFFVQSDLEQIAYDKAMSTYYPSVFRSLDTIFSSATNATIYINQYGGYINQSEGYIEQYNSIKNLAFSGMMDVVGLMAVFGVFIPMSLLGLANWYEPKLNNPKCRNFYYFLIIVSILVFVITTTIGVYLLGTQISRLFIPP